MALQGDILHPEIRTHALTLLFREWKKRPDILKQRIFAGIRRSYCFQRAVYPNNMRVTALLNNSTECIFDKIFKDAVRTSRVQSTRIIRSLLDLFSGTNIKIDDVYNNLNTDTDKTKKTLPNNNFEIIHSNSDNIIDLDCVDDENQLNNYILNTNQDYGDIQFLDNNRSINYNNTNTDIRNN